MESVFTRAPHPGGMRRAVVVLVVLALVVTPAPAAAQSDGTSLEGTVTFDVHVRSDGDARWNVSTAFDLETANDSAAFDRVAAEFENGGGGAGGFDVAVAERMVAAATERTNRSMAVSGVERTAVVHGSGNNSTGVLALEFTWSNFSELGNDTLTVGDVFGPWTLGPDQRLRVHGPEGYGLNDASPAPATLEDGTATWAGEREFEAGHPSLTFTRAADPTTTPSEPTGGGLDLGFVAAVVGAVLLGGLLAYGVARRDELFGDGDATPAGTGPATPGDGGDGHDGDGGGEAATVDPELLSDEERVERLLEDSGGRMKQADIVEETGWSNAKVSQLLSGMAEDGRVEKLRIGRENLISLPDADVTDDE